MNYLGYVLGLFLMAWALSNVFGDGINTSDDSIKDKISIIEQAENSTDPLIKEQGIIAKKELREIQQKKELRSKKENEEQKAAEAKKPLLDKPISIFNVVILVFGVFGIILAGFRFLSSRVRRGY